MTDTPEIAPSSPENGPLILFVAFPGMCLLDMTGPLTVFWAATRYRSERGMPAYRRHTVSLHGGLLPTVEGVSLQTAALSDFAGMDIDTIVLPGSPEIERIVAESAELVAWLRQVGGRARRVASVCSGAFLLAQAGLLDGRRAATHWGMCDRLQALFPAVIVDRDAIFIEHEKIWTSAGVTAGIDLALALVEHDGGRDIAMKVARELVVFLKRPGGQSQFSELLQSQSRDGLGFEMLHLWITDNLENAHLSVDALAEKMSMSPRNFSRAYKQATGRSPAKAVEIIRLEAARRLLEQSQRNAQQIALQCGFGDEERMRVTFQRHLAVSPSDYRKRFSR
jgi:transcriptional regulator GlxA family with amidase domain